MIRKKWLAVMGIALTVSLVGVLGASAVSAQDSGTATATPETPSTKTPRGHTSVGPLGSGTAAVAELLGMTEDEIRAERVLGKTLMDIANDKGVSEQALVDAMVASQKTLLDKAVENGRMTQEQADKWLEWYKQAAALKLTEPYAPGVSGMGGFAGCGRGPGHGRGGAGDRMPMKPGTEATPEATPDA